jgi:hypothetical protein
LHHSAMASGLSDLSVWRSVNGSDLVVTGIRT